MRPTHSIIIPVFNQLHFTKGCLESLLADTDRPAYEIIIVDNASTDGTRSYLEELARRVDRSDDLLKLIFNEENLGVAKAWNQGLREFTGTSVGILNNDIVVSHGWFRSLLWALDFHRLHLISPFAQVGPLNYDFKTRAEKFTRKNIDKFWNDYDFCAFLMPRSTFEKIGFFDENFQVGGYEDTDYCYRLRKESMTYAVSGSAFIHHFGSQTLGEFKKRGDKHAASNKEYFISKWGEDPSKSVGKLSAKLRRTIRRFKLHWDRM